MLITSQVDLEDLSGDTVGSVVVLQSQCNLIRVLATEQGLI